MPFSASGPAGSAASGQAVGEGGAISGVVQERIRRIYGRESLVIHPPVDTQRFTPDPSVSIGSYFLIVSRLIPYKRVDLAIDAFRGLPNEKLIVVGSGRDRTALEAAAPANVTFLGWQAADRQLELVRGCKAFLFPGLEDFGIAPVEAMSAGRPVIAYRGGGALDTVIPARTGVFFDEQTPESLRLAVSNQEPGILARVPGIGKRTAEKVVVELKDKLAPAEGDLAALATAPDADAEVMEALTSLGYSVVEAQRALQQIPADVTGVEERLRLALSRFGE